MESKPKDEETEQKDEEQREYEKHEEFKCEAHDEDVIDGACQNPHENSLRCAVCRYHK